MAADGNFQVDAPTAAVFSSLGTAVLAWLGNRLVGKAAIQTAINTTFRELMEQLRQELRVAINERDDARDDRDRLEAELRKRDETIASLKGPPACLPARRRPSAKDAP